MLSKYLAVDFFPTLRGSYIAVDNNMLFGTDVCGNLLDGSQSQDAWAMVPRQSTSTSGSSSKYPARLDSIVFFNSAAQLRAIGWTERVLHSLSQPTSTAQWMSTIRQSYPNNIGEIHANWHVEACSAGGVGRTPSHTDAVLMDCPPSTSSSSDDDATHWSSMTMYWDLYPVKNLRHLRGGLVQFINNENIIWT